MDVSKLTAAPWTTGGVFNPDSARPSQWVWGPHASANDQSGKVVAVDISIPDAEFIALARNALDVMMRRQTWYVRCWELPDRRVYKVFGDGLDSVVCRNMLRMRDDPFTALVDADKWYRENAEGKL